MKVASTTKKMFEKRLFSFSCLKLYLLGVKYSNLDVEFYFCKIFFNHWVAISFLTVYYFHILSKKHHFFDSKHFHSDGWHFHQMKVQSIAVDLISTFFMFDFIRDCKNKRLIIFKLTI